MDFVESILFQALLDSLPPVPLSILREPCLPDEVTLNNGLHVHRCQCGTAWKHDDLLPIFCTSEEFSTAHTCPACGSEVTEKAY